MSASEAVHMYTTIRRSVRKFRAKQFALFRPDFCHNPSPRLLLVFNLIIRSQLLRVIQFCFGVFWSLQNYDSSSVG
jgi:hypothetical protein